MVSPPDLSDLKADHAGNYVILISGHRRKRAIWQLAQKHELDISHVHVQINMRSGIGFEEALIAQVCENTYEKVPPEETAKYIEQFYTYLLSEQSKRPTHKEVAAKLGLSDSVVATALRFCSLPQEIQNLTHSKKMPYSTIAKLEVIMRKRAEYYTHQQQMGQQPPETLEEYCLSHLHIIANKIMRIRLEKSERVDTLIKREVTSLDQLTSSYQDELVLLSPDMRSARGQRNRSATILATTAFSSLVHAVEQNPHALDNSKLSLLQQLIDDAKRVAESTAAQPDAFLF